MLKTLTDAEAPPHPGEILREDILPQTGLGGAELARHLDVPAAIVDELLEEQRSISVDLARRLGAAFGQGARYWLGVQALYDMWQAEQPALKPVRVKPISFEGRPARRAAS